MKEPAVKGSIIAAVVEDLVRLRDGGRITSDELETGLESEDLALLEGKLNTATWYPMASYARFLQTLGNVEASGDQAYFIERGRKNARRLMDAGLYQQLNFLPRWKESVLASSEVVDEAAAIAGYARNLRLVVSMAQSIYNVGTWVAENDEDYPGRVQIAIRDAGDYSEPMRLAAEGFLNECAVERGRVESRDLYTSERPSPDLILFRMNFDVTDLATRRSAARAGRG